MDAADRKLLDALQSGFPLVPRPFAALGAALGLSEGDVIERLARLHNEGLMRRIGPVLDPEKLGLVSALAAMAVPEERLEAVAATVAACPSVTHNYQRVPIHGACPYNLWFTLTATSQPELETTVAALERSAGLPITILPARQKFKIDVRFALAEDGPNG